MVSVLNNPICCDECNALVGFQLGSQLMGTVYCILCAEQLYREEPTLEHRIYDDAPLRRSARKSKR